MRIGFASALKPVWPKVDWYVQAASKLGHSTSRSSHRDQLGAILSECDFVVFGQKDLPGRWPNICRLMEGPRCTVVYLWFDLVATDPGRHIKDQPIFLSHDRTFVAADISIVKERSLLHEYRELGVNAHWVDQGCPSHIAEVDRSRDPEFDLLVWGQVGRYRERQRAVERAVSAGFRVAWAGNQPVPKGVVPLPWTPPLELPQLASRARCVLSVGIRNDIEGYWSDGFWLAVGMGACVIRRSTPGLPRGPYLTFSNSDELIAHLTWAKQNPELADEMGRESRKWVIANHTIEHRVQEIIGLVAPTAAGQAISECRLKGEWRSGGASA